MGKHAEIFAKCIVDTDIIARFRVRQLRVPVLVNKTSNALVMTKEDCLKKLFTTVRTTRRIPEIVRQRVPYRRTSDRKRPTAVCVESTARYNELVSVCGTQTKPRSDVGGCDEMVGEVPR